MNDEIAEKLFNDTMRFLFKFNADLSRLSFGG